MSWFEYTTGSMVLLFSLGLLAKLLLYKRENRLLKQVMEQDPFLLDLEKLTVKITVKRENKKPTVELSLLTILDVVSVEGKSLAHMAEDFTKALGLEKEDALTEVEVRVIMMYVTPTLFDFYTSLKKASPFGLDSPKD